MRKTSLLVLLIFGLVLSGNVHTAAWAAEDVSLVTIETLKETLNEPGLVILDVRSGKDWNASQYKIPGAIRQDAGDVQQITQAYAKDTKIVAYCA